VRNQARSGADQIIVEGFEEINEKGKSSIVNREARPSRCTCINFTICNSRFTIYGSRFTLQLLPTARDNRSRAWTGRLRPRY
jgi:hypothetical protein